MSDSDSPAEDSESIVDLVNQAQCGEHVFVTPSSGGAMAYRLVDACVDCGIFWDRVYDHRAKGWETADLAARRAQSAAS